MDLKGKSCVRDWKRKPDRLFLEDRIVCSTITQLRTGHGHFGTFLPRMGFRDNDCCVCADGPRETPQHLPFHRPRYSKDRLAAAKSSRIPLYTKAFLYSDISHKTLASLIRDTKIGARLEREQKEAGRAGAAIIEDDEDDDGDLAEGVAARRQQRI